MAKQKVKQKSEELGCGRSAKELLKAGLSVIPVYPADYAEEGRRKKPVEQTWKEYQAKRMTIEQAESSFNNGSSVAVICGTISGNAELLDFDNPKLFAPFCEMAEEISPGILKNIIQQETPSGGFHLFYLHKGETSGNKILAKSRIIVDDSKPDREEIDEKTGVIRKYYLHDGKEVLSRICGTDRVLNPVAIETRGEGGYFLCDPSPGYKASGLLQNTATITAEQRETLLSVARSFTEIPAPQPYSGQERTSDALDHRPGDRFNQGEKWPDLLDAAGWTFQGTTGERENWSRPGKPKGTSATLHPELGLFVFSSSTELPTGIPVDKFGFFCHTIHGGDFKKAAAAAAEIYPSGGKVVFDRLEQDIEWRFGVCISIPDEMKEWEAPPAAVPNKDLPSAIAVGYKILKTCHHRLLYDYRASNWYWKEGDTWHPMDEEVVRAIVDPSVQLLRRSSSVSYITLVMQLLEEKMRFIEWHNHPLDLPVENGVVDLESQSLKNYSLRYRFNWQVPFDYDMDQKCPAFKKYLKDCTKGDKELKGLIQAAMFAVLAGMGPKLQVFLELCGPGGTGKSLLVRVLEGLLDSSSIMSTDIKSLEDNRFEAIGLLNARLALINDSPKYGGELSVLKAATGGDLIRGEKKFGGLVPFRFNGTVVIVCNEPFRSSDLSSGVSRRRVTLPFVQRVTNKQMEKWSDCGGIEKAIQGELPGVLNWILKIDSQTAAQRIKNREGIAEKQRREVAILTSSIAAFAEAMLKVSAKGEIGADTARKGGGKMGPRLYPSYRKWCEANGFKAVSSARFGRTFEDTCTSYGVPVKKIVKNTGTVYRGISFRRKNDDSPRLISI